MTVRLLSLPHDDVEAAFQRHVEHNTRRAEQREREAAELAAASEESAGTPGASGRRSLRRQSKKCGNRPAVAR